LDVECGKLYLLKVYGAKLAMAADSKTIFFSIKGARFRNAKWRWHYRKERDQLALPNMFKVTVWRRPKDFRFVRSSRVSIKQ
jgi:hypothetical protein